MTTVAYRYLASFLPKFMVCRLFDGFHRADFFSLNLQRHAVRYSQASGCVATSPPSWPSPRPYTNFTLAYSVVVGLAPPSLHGNGLPYCQRRRSPPLPPKRPLYFLQNPTLKCNYYLRMLPFVSMTCRLGNTLIDGLRWIRAMPV